MTWGRESRETEVRGQNGVGGWREWKDTVDVFHRWIAEESDCQGVVRHGRHREGGSGLTGHDRASGVHVNKRGNHRTAGVWAHQSK